MAYEVPKPGIRSEPQQQGQVPLTHYARQGIEPTSCHSRVTSYPGAPQRELLITYLYPFISWRTLRLLPYLGNCKSCCYNTGVHVSFQITIFILFRYILRNRTAGSYGSSIFSFLRNFHTVFLTSFTNLHSHQEPTRIPFSPHPCPHLLFANFLTIVTRAGVRWWLVVLIFISLMMLSSVEHLVLCLVVIYIPSLEKHLLRHSAHFLIRLGFLMLYKQGQHFFLSFFVFLPFLGLLPQHMEVPRLGVQLEL